MHCATTTFNQSSLRHCARKARGCHTVEPSSFFAWIPVRKVSGNVLPWFTCTTRWKSSCLTFPTPAFVFSAVCESFTNLDAFDFRDLYRFLSKHKFSSPCAYLVATSWYVCITSWCVQGHMLSYIFVVFFLADKLEVIIWRKVSLQSQFCF